jgi:hypothetical protein
MYGMKSESNEGRLLNDEGKVIYYSGTENFPKVMREYYEAMVKRGLGKIMHTSNASEPKRILRKHWVCIQGRNKMQDDKDCG